MTTTTAAHASTGPARAPKLTFAGTLRSEWIKFFAVRSTAWMLGATLVVMVGFSAMMAAAFRLGAQGSGNVEISGDPSVAGVSMMGLDPGLMSVTFSYGVAQIVIAVLGVLAMTGEFSTGRIRSTFVAVPRRLSVLAAKMIVVAVTAFVTAAIAIAASYLVVLAILSSADLAPDLTVTGALRSLIGVPLYLTAIALFSLAVGTLVRSTSGSIAAVLGVILVLPIISLIPFDWIATASEFLPAAAGERLFNASIVEMTLGPWQGFGVLCAWVVVLMTLGSITLRSRDA